MLLKEVGTNSKEELRTLMRDRDIWRGLSGVDRPWFRHSSSSNCNFNRNIFKTYHVCPDELLILIHLLVILIVISRSQKISRVS